MWVEKVGGREKGSGKEGGAATRVYPNATESESFIRVI